jgi:hypothetical protein
MAITLSGSLDVGILILSTAVKGISFGFVFNCILTGVFSSPTISWIVVFRLLSVVLEGETFQLTEGSLIWSSSTVLVGASLTEGSSNSFLVKDSSNSSLTEGSINSSSPTVSEGSSNSFLTENSLSPSSQSNIRPRRKLRKD